LKLTGVNADVISKAKSPIQKYFGVLGKIMNGSLIVILIALFLLPSDMIFTTRFFGAENCLIKIAGFLIGIGGLTICRIAQRTIGKSWRVGIDEGAKPGLVTNGIYRFIRNPTYTGLFTLYAGVFVILPTIPILCWILAFFIMMEFQVRCEEEYLEKQYGDEFTKYAKSTKRYIPFVY
jgi:protein-S-isoprenylcysteine O-methyltransferase Ste14